MQITNRKNSWCVKHDMSHTSLYSRWRDIKQRCLNPNNNNYKYYGGRGIKICEEWLDFNNFRQWALNNGYSEELSIDRIDNNGDYEPLNCRWVTQSIQCMNMRRKNTSGFIGICKHSSDGKWYGRVKVNGKCYYTGRSESIIEAVRMRNDFIIKNNLPNRLNEVQYANPS